MPFPFYLTALTAILIGLYAWSGLRQAWGIPALAVIGTVTVWYLGDAIYNDYAEYVQQFGAEALGRVWWQVIGFLVAFALLVRPVHRMINRRHLRKGSSIMRLVTTRAVDQPLMQRRLTMVTSGLVMIWAGLMVIALVRTQFDVAGLFAPYLGHKANPWGRGRLGGGFDALISFASYLQVFLAAAFGVVAALAKNPNTRTIAMVICFLTWPYYIFDRTRNTMLATVLPGFLAWVFLRVRAGYPVKMVILAVGFVVVNSWFLFVLHNRTDNSIARAFREAGGIEVEEDERHLGLNMYEELAWIDYFIQVGAYEVNNGQRYWAELVNPIPRSLWRGKPLIGIDYAIARGQGEAQSRELVTATISTGMIGQGVVNFGRLFGPIAAAFLMAIWVAVLARQDLLGQDPGRLLLYTTGLILTFNLGRDITLLVLYPFLFGLAFLLVWRKFFQPLRPDPQPARQSASVNQPSPLPK